MTETDIKAFHAGIDALHKELKKLNNSASDIHDLQAKILKALSIPEPQSGNFTKTRF